MKIEIKYNIGEQVFLIRDNEVQKHQIKSISFTKTSTNGRILYSFVDMFSLEDIRESEFSTEDGLEWWDEDKLFPTKEELLKSL